MWSIGFSSITGIDKKYLQYSDLKNRELDFDAIPKLPHTWKNICTSFNKSIIFTVLINYCCSAQVHRKITHMLFTQPQTPTADIFTFFSLILYFLLGSLSCYFVSECGRQNNCLYISCIDFLHSSNTVVRLATQESMTGPCIAGFVFQEKEALKIQDSWFSTACTQGQTLEIKTKKCLKEKAF